MNKMAEVVVRESLLSPQDVIDKLKRIFEQKAIKLFSLVDHSAEALKAGLSLTDEKLLIFGDPKVGTFLMQENPLIGLELPLKILVFQESGKTKIAYLDPSLLKKRYHIEKNGLILDKMAEAFENLIRQVS